MKRTVIVCWLVLVALPLAVYGQESTRDDFVAYTKTQTGRWVSEVTWIADWPGLGRKGEKVTAYYEGSLTEDGNAVIGRFFGGDGSATSLVVYDAGAKQITETVVTSGGTVWRAVVARKGDKFVSHAKGSNADGSAVDTTSTLTLSDDGNTGTWTGTGTVAGKKTEQNDVWRRVNAKE
jgi:hypothetical protein